LKLRLEREINKRRKRKDIDQKEIKKEETPSTRPQQG